MRTALTLLTILALAGAVAAQNPAPDDPPDRFAGSGPSPLPSGDTMTVRFDHPAKANQEVTIIVHDLFFPQETRTIKIQLGADGKGQQPFTPPSTWDGAVLTHPDSQDHLIVMT